MTNTNRSNQDAAFDFSDDFSCGVQADICNSDDPTAVVIIDHVPNDWECEEITQVIPLETMAELVGMAPIGPDRPTRDLRLDVSDGVPRQIVRERSRSVRLVPRAA